MIRRITLKQWFTFVALCMLNGAVAQTKHSPSSQFPSYTGLVMAGYQGWFNAPDDGAGRGWNHYVAHGEFGPGNCKVDLWPDVSEYKQVYKTPFKTADSLPAYLFSSYDASTTDLHFKWMKEYGIDGVFVQRFIGSTRGGKALLHNDKVLAQALEASRKYQRAIAVMYDLSGMKDDDQDPETVIRDWKHLVDSLKLTGRGSHQTYLYHNGKPLVAVWGVGFPGRAYGLKGPEKIIDFLKNDPVYGGCAVLLGVPTYWRDLSNDAMNDPHLHDLLRKADIVQPWFVGRYNEDSYPKFKTRVRDDIQWCKQNNLDYVPVVFPGFSWHNMYPKSPQNQIPRNRGRFFWEQLAGDIGAGADKLYVAMFDEIDEGTAIFKLSKNPPVGASGFVALEEDVPGDYYLFLAGYAGRMLRAATSAASADGGKSLAPADAAGIVPNSQPPTINHLTPIPNASTPADPVSWVDPLIGSGGHGHVFVGASVPFGGVQLGPENFYKGWDWCSGYNYGDSVMIGFAHTHLSGTGIGDLADILIAPYTGDIKTDKGVETKPGSGYASHYSHATETARPGYYSVKLDDYNIRAELTASERVGFHQYHFPEGAAAHVIIDLKEGINDQSTDTWLQQVDPYTFEGYRRSKGWAKDQWLFFAIKSSVPIQKFNLYDNDQPLEGADGKGKAIKGVMSFDQAPPTLQLKVGLSPVSAENALANIAAEIPGWDFNGTAVAAREKWNKELSKIDITTSSEKDRRIFYTALYHTMIDPAIFNDVNGDYRGADKQIYRHAPFTNYSVFSLWDTYRAENPLLNILQPQRVSDMVQTMLAIGQRQKLLPIWHLMANETGTMVGVSSLEVISEAWLKGIKGFDTDSAYQALKKTAMSDTLGLQYVRDGRAIPSDVERRSVARAMEYAIGEGSIALMAKKLGHKEDYEYFRKRAGDYKLYYDKNTGFFRGIKSDGTFSTPFDAFKTTPPWSSDYAEGNAWQYLWLAPQDIKGLMKLMGGEKIFLKRLDSLFSAEPAERDTHALADITGTIGQYAHGNEPSHHIAYLYAYGGRQWQTAEKVRYILDEFYHDNPDGVIGNEDCGQMSAWYVFSALGFYPVFPASGVYVMGSPIFDKATLHLEGGKTFTVITVTATGDGPATPPGTGPATAPGVGPENKYIQSMELNGKPYPGSYILHSDILRGGTLKITMGSRPNYAFGQLEGQRPPDGRQ